MKIIPTESLSNWTDSTSGAAWAINTEGHITQTKLVGNSKAGSGGKLIFKGTPLIEENAVRFTCIPGSTQETGFVFNYIDDRNYTLVLIDKKAKPAKMWALAVCLIEKGVLHYLCKENYDGLPPKEMVFEIRNDGNDLDVLANGKMLYRLLSTNLQRLTFLGVYSQKNNDAVFKEINALKAIQPMPDKGLPSEPVTDNAAPRFLPNHTIKDQATEKIKSFLKLNVPISKSVIEFKRGYRVALDSLYSSIYVCTELQRPKEPNGNYKTTQAVSLDYRPSRWYREYKNITKSIQLAGNDVKRHHEILMSLENGGVYPENVEYQVHDQHIGIWRRRYLVSQDKLEQLLTEKKVLLTEMRIAGYMVREQNVPAELLEQGYDFFLVSGIAGYSDFSPINIDPFADLKKDSVWKEIESSLQNRLFNNVRFSQTSKERYLNKVLPLADKKSHLPLIQSDLTDSATEIQALESQIVNCKKQLEDYSAQIQKWTADKTFLQAQVVNYRTYSSGEYPSSGGGLGPQNSQSFINFISGSCKSTLKALTYQHSINSSNFSVHINQYGSLRWSHDYAISTTSILHEAYHSVFRFWEGGWQTERNHAADWYETIYSYTFGEDPNVRNFFDVGVRICDQYINVLLPTEIEKLNKKIITLQNNALGLGLKKNDIEENGLKISRQDFLDKWNRSDVIESTVTGEKLVDPNTDPLTDLIADIERENEAFEVYYINLQSDGYYTQDGQSLQKFLSIVPKLPHMVVLILPVFDQNNKPLTEVRTAIVNPIRSNKVAKLPTITFVETYQTEVNWIGYALGELTQTINLFPGESKRLILESATNKRSMELAGSDTQQEREGIEVSSFESELSNEMARSSMNALSSAETNTSNRKEQISNIVSHSKTETDSWNIGGVISGKLGKADIAIDGGYESTDSTTNTNTKTDALSVFQSANLQKANKESKESFKKEIDNTLKRVASETSNKNKVSLKTMTNSEISTSNSRQETILIENPNVGRTVNYNFFQLQNVYETSTNLVDVKIVLDPSVELMQNSEVTDLRVYELEEFTKIYANSDEKDPHSAIMSVIVARQVFKNYLDSSAQGDSRSALISTDALPIDEQMLNVLNLSNEWDTEGTLEENIVNSFKEALTYLKSRSFRFNKTTFIEPKTQGINTGSYYMDAEVGAMPATEAYLEERRGIETEMQRVGLDHIRAQTKAGVFYPNLSNVNALTLDKDINTLKAQTH